MKTHILTHTDLDGVVAAAVYLRLSKEYENTKIHFVEPYNLINSLKDLLRQKNDIEKIAIMDLGINIVDLNNYLSVLDSLKNRDITIEWYDHHIWEKNVISLFNEKGVKLVIDTSTCGAGVVAKYAFEGLEEKDCMWTLIEAVCAADIWTWNHHLAPVLYRVYSFPRGPIGDRKRRDVLNELVNCRYWNDDFEHLLESYINSELKGYLEALNKQRVYQIEKTTFTVTLKPAGPPNTSFLASYLLSKTNSDLAVIIKHDGSISLRSRNGMARKIAVCMGGGGHPNASGARISPSLPSKLIWWIPILRKWWLKRKVPEKIIECIKRSYDR